MILKKEITEKSQLWGVPPDTVDKDWALGHFLIAFMQVDNHKEKLVFKGGTCLRKCRFTGYRFSEDLDFTAKDEKYKLTKPKLNEAIGLAKNSSGIPFHLAELQDLIHNDKLAGYQAKIKFWGANHGKIQNPPSQERWLTTIKIEITLFEKMVFPVQECPVEHPYSDSGLFKNKKVPCYDLKEVISEKIRSLIQRSYTAPRDFFDIWFLKDSFSDKEWCEIKKAFLEKLTFKGHAFTGIDQLINDRTTDILKKSWDQSLVHQVHAKALPDFNTVVSDLTELFKKHLQNGK